MRKKTIAILFIVGIIVSIIGSVLFTAGAASAVTVSPDGVAQATGAVNPGLFFGGIALLVIASIMTLISWIGALIATARLGRWGWFVCVLILTGLGELIYLIAGPSISTLGTQQ